MTEPSLARGQIDQLIRDGFVRLEEAFPRSLAEECLRLLRGQTGLDPANPATRQRPVIRLPGSDAEPFVRAADTTPLLGAFDQLVGQGRWYPRPNLCTFPIRFPSAEVPGDAGIDGSYRGKGELYANLWSRERALLTSPLTRIIREQAPTLTPALLIEEGEGVNSMPSPPEGERVRVRGRVGRRRRDREWCGLR